LIFDIELDLMTIDFNQTFSITIFDLMFNDINN